MLKRKQIGIQLGAVVMLMLFIGVMANNLFCNYSHMVDALGMEHKHPFGHDHHQTHQHEHDLSHDHSNHHNEYLQLALEIEHDLAHTHNGLPDEDCCNELALVFLSTLLHDEETGFDFSIGEFALFVPELVFVDPLGENNLYLGARNYIEPPPNIPNIRVFIQSFQV